MYNTFGVGKDDSNSSPTDDYFFYELGQMTWPLWALGSPTVLGLEDP